MASYVLNEKVGIEDEGSSHVLVTHVQPLKGLLGVGKHVRAIRLFCLSLVRRHSDIRFNRVIA